MTRPTTPPDTRTTIRGDALAWKLNPAIGTTTGIRQTCALIARHARTLAAYYLAEANDEQPADVVAWRERRTEALERRVADLVADLPHTDAGPIGCHLNGDPRGNPVKLVMPGEWARLHDDWGRVGVNVEVD